MSRRVYRRFAAIAASGVAVALGVVGALVWSGPGMESPVLRTVHAQQAAVELYSEPFYYGYNGEPVTLVASPDTVGVRFNQEMSPNELESFIVVQGLYNPLPPGESFETLPEEHTGVFSTDLSLPGTEALDSIEAILENPAVEAVYPAFRLNGEEESILTDIVSMTVRSSALQSVLDKLLDDGLALADKPYEFPKFGVIGLRVTVTEFSRAQAGEDSIAVANRYAGMPNVLEAVPNFLPLYPLTSSILEPDDPDYLDGASQPWWYLLRMRAPEAWHLAYQGSWGNLDNGPRPKIAVIDDGVSLNYNSVSGVPPADPDHYNLDPDDFADIIDGHDDLRDNQWLNMAEVNGATGVDDDENGYVDDYYGQDFMGSDPTVESNDPVPFPDFHGNPVLEGLRQHGTAAAGNAAARGNNSDGMIGICPSCLIMPVRYHNNLFDVNNPGGSTDVFYVGRIVDAINYASGHVAKAEFAGTDSDTKADVMICMFGQQSYDPLVRIAIQQARANGLTVFVPASNNNRSLDARPEFPQVFPEVITVGASDNGIPSDDVNHTGDATSEKRASFELDGNGQTIPLHDSNRASNYSWALDVLAPSMAEDGLNNRTTHWDNNDPQDPWKVQGGSGTSAAVPIAAGTGGLMRKVNPKLSPAEIQYMMQDTAVDVEYTIDDQYGSKEIAGPGRDRYTGFGRIDMAAAVARAMEPRGYIVKPDAGRPGGTRSMFSVDQTGTGIIDGAIQTNTSQTTLNDTAGSGMIISYQGAIIARFDMDWTVDTMNPGSAKWPTFYIKGEVLENQGTLNPPAGSPKIWRHGGTVDAYLSPTGDFVAAGPVIQAPLIDTLDAPRIRNCQPCSPPAIQGMLANAEDGDVIIVPQGIYEFSSPLDFGQLPEGGAEEVNVVLRSSDPYDPAVVNGTILTLEDSPLTTGRIIQFEGDETEDSAIMGFTFKGRGLEGNVAGITSPGGGTPGDGSRARIMFNVFHDLDAPPGEDFGGAIHNCDGLIEGNRFGFKVDGTPGGNHADLGGAIWNCDGDIIENMFRYNVAERRGGAIGLSTAFEIEQGMFRGGLIQGNFIGDNQVLHATDNRGGAIVDCDGVIRSNVIWNNTARIGGALADCGMASDSVLIEQNTIYGNHATTSTGGGAMNNCVTVTGENRNNILWMNTEAGQDYTQNNAVKQIRNGSGGLPTFSAIQESTDPNPGNGNIGPFNGVTDLNFVSETLTANAPGTLPSQNWETFLHLESTSLCIDRTDPNVAPTEIFRDFDDAVGPLDGGTGLGILRDMGADEFPTPDPEFFTFWWERF